jgi:arylformamidase
MAIYDVTVSLRAGMPVYPGDPPFRRIVTARISQGASSNMSRLDMGAHLGTHVDAPHHIVDGTATIDALPGELLIGPARVVPIEDPCVITLDELRRHDWGGVERVLFQTANADKLETMDGFIDDFVYLDGAAAEFLAAQDVRLVGVDYLSVDFPHSGTHPAHQALMQAGVIIIEGLNLHGVPPGDYEMFCGPLKVQGGDGAPARVFLRG